MNSFKALGRMLRNIFKHIAGPPNKKQHLHEKRRSKQKDAQNNNKLSEHGPKFGPRLTKSIPNRLKLLPNSIKIDYCLFVWVVGRGVGEKGGQRRSNYRSKCDTLGTKSGPKAHFWDPRAPENGFQNRLVASRCAFWCLKPVFLESFENTSKNQQKFNRKTCVF